MIWDILILFSNTIKDGYYANWDAAHEFTLSGGHIENRLKTFTKRGAP